jgi:hypothetical protein
VKALLLHAGGWDELAIMGVAILLAIVIVKLTMRGQADDEPDEAADAALDDVRPADESE